MSTLDQSQPIEPIPIEQHLTDFLTQNLAVSQYLGMKVQSYDSKTLTLSIDLKPSLNDKLTAWGGSLYGLTVMNCWGMYYLQCRERDIEPNLVVSQGVIDYLLPVDDTIIISSCYASTVDWDKVFTKVARSGRATVSLKAHVFNGKQKAVEFTGRYTLVGIKN